MERLGLAGGVGGRMVGMDLTWDSLKLRKLTFSREKRREEKRREGRKKACFTLENSSWWFTEAF